MLKLLYKNYPITNPLIFHFTELQKCNSGVIEFIEEHKHKFKFSSKITLLLDSNSVFTHQKPHIF